MDWPRLVKKYVWDDDRTPYFARAGRLTPAQARSELFVYAFLLAVLSSLVAVIAAAGEGRPGLRGSPAIALYAATVLLGAILLGATGHPVAAGYCATAPVAVGLAALAGVLRPGMVGGEQVVVGALSLLWLGYAARVVRIARRLHGRD
ncbi:MAG: hypothetical protein ACREJV_14720 [Candidatus Rokuibacteriota bacterium]